MGISVLDRKMLWGRSGMKCAMCQTALSEEHELGGAVIIGEEAHIIAQNQDGPRGNSLLSEADRNRYSNLILLCPTDHARIDKLPADYPPEMLHSIKAKHEAAVIASANFDKNKQMTEENWARLLDQLNDIVQWQTWPSNVAPFFNRNSPWVRKAFIDQLRRANEWIYGRVWPEGHEKLRSAIEAFGLLVADWMCKFEEHSESPTPYSHSVTTEKFYKVGNYAPDRYHRLVEEYQDHVALLEDLALEATRYGNYIASLIRDEVDPSFRFDEGLLLITVATDTFQHQLLKPEFKLSDFNDGEPYIDLETFERERSRRDITAKELDT
jgi:hypothetical protein